MPARVFLLVLVSLALALGCSKSSTSEASSEGSSDSSASSSGSSSGPSRYVREVRDYTYQFVLSGGPIEEFSRGLGPIAEKRGVADWESNEDTYEGIGRGLKRTGVSGARLESLKQQFADSNIEREAWIQKAYEKQKKD
jgi:hypothetical protein